LAEHFPDLFASDGVTAWGAVIRLTNVPDNSEIPSVAVSGNNVHVSWQDLRDGNYEIYYKKYTAPALHDRCLDRSRLLPFIYSDYTRSPGKSTEQVANILMN
jgi:hypothetical protein